MRRLDPVIVTISAAALVAVSAGLAANAYGPKLGADLAQVASPALAETPATSVTAPWAASATGRVEPKDGEIRIASQVPGRIVEVLVKNNDKVEEGDLLVRLDDAEIYAKIAAAQSEASVREREREEEKATGLAADRRAAADVVAKAERALFAAREAFDAAQRARKTGADTTSAEREKLKTAQTKLASAKAALDQVNAKPEMPLEQRLEASLSFARSELTQAEIALERTRLRAPASGTVLNSLAKAGETASPSPESTLITFGDLSALRLRAEVEERDAAKVHKGQKVVIRADAFPDRQFEGTVASISQSLGAPRIASRGPRRPNDVEVVEVMVDIDGNPPLFTGMRVDAFFKNDTAASASSARVEAASATDKPY